MNKHGIIRVSIYFNTFYPGSSCSSTDIPIFHVVYVGTPERVAPYGIPFKATPCPICDTRHDRGMEKGRDYRPAKYNRR